MNPPPTYGSRNEEEHDSFIPPSETPSTLRSTTKRTALLAASVGILSATGAYIALHDTIQPHIASINTSASLQADFLAQSSVQAKDAFTSFDALDTDRNGYVTKQEFLTRLETRRDDVIARIISSNLDKELKNGILNVVKSHSTQEASCISKIFNKSAKGAVDRDGFDFVVPIIVDICAISPDGIQGQEEDVPVKESGSLRGSSNGESDVNPLPDTSNTDVNSYQDTTGAYDFGNNSDENTQDQDNTESGGNLDIAGNDETASSGADALTGGDETANDSGSNVDTAGGDETTTDSGSNLDTAGNDETASSGADALTGGDETANDSGSNVDTAGNDETASDIGSTTGSYDSTPYYSTPEDVHDDWDRSEDNTSSPPDDNIFSPAEFDDSNGSTVSRDDSNPIFNDSTSSEEGTNNDAAYSPGSSADDQMSDTSFVNASEAPFELPPAVQEFNNDLTSTNEKSTARTDFETELAQKFQSEMELHQQKLAYAQMETQKQTFLLSLIESCISNAGQKFQYDPTFDISTAMTWMKNVCLQFPDPHHQDV